jgi:hypothetical protein
MLNAAKATFFISSRDVGTAFTIFSYLFIVGFAEQTSVRIEALLVVSR